MTVFSGVRCEKIKDLHHLQIIENHGKRLDSSRERINKKLTQSNYKYSEYSDKKDALNLTQNFGKIIEKGVKTYGKSCIGLHCILSISSELISKYGDIHDSNNEMNKKIMKSAINWAKTEFGEGSILGARMDFDEDGGGNIDLILTPIHEVKQRKTTKKVISVSKSLSAIRKRYKKGTKEYESLQNSWHEFAVKNIDKSIQRGISKEITKLEHNHHSFYKKKLNEIESEIKEELDKSKLKKVVKYIDICKEMITDEKSKEIDKKVTEKTTEITEKYDKKVSSLQNRLDISLSNNNKLFKENQKLSSDFQKLEKENNENKKIIVKIKDFLKNRYKNIFSELSKILPNFGDSFDTQKGAENGRKQPFTSSFQQKR